MMVKEIITFGDTEIKKRKFLHCKYLTLLQDVKFSITHNASKNKPLYK